MDDKDNIASKDINIDKTVYQILNEAYHEFKQTYGEKHSGHIKELIESITDKVKIAPHYYSGAIASAHSEMGVVYTKSDKLSAVLKHEMWHIYNNSAQDREKSLQYIPERYMEQLESNGYLRKTYQTTMEEYKEKWKDEPERLEFLLIDYEKYKNERFDFDDSPVEMWTEWFNSKTHLKDMQDNFWDWGDGYYTKSHSSDSFYDSYINIADMISCIIPKEKLLEMYLQTTDYKTDYSYPEMLEEFDTKYAEALNESEKEEYKYPYLKMILDVKTISDNARKNPTVAREALQSCMTTCFNSYLIKLNNIKEMDMEKAKNIYSEIKYMQEQMVWNTDISKMQELDYTKAMEKIQEKFKQLMQEMDIEKPEVQNMLETIDYKESNPYVFIENGEEISKKIIETQNDKKGQLVDINGYKANVGTEGIKGNLYSSLFTLLGDEKYNLLFENFNNETDNILLDFYKLIESATNESDIVNIYNKIYELYADKLESTLKTDENIAFLFERYSKEIVELQRNALFDDKEQKYFPKLEQIIDIYQQKAHIYEQEVDKVTEKEIQKYLSEGRTTEQATKWAERVPNIYKKELNEQKNRMNGQRKNQVIEYKKLQEEKPTVKLRLFSEQEIGKNTINRDVSRKEQGLKQIQEDEKMLEPNEKNQNEYADD